MINNRSIINWHIGFNDHTLPSRLQLVSMIALYDIYWFIYSVRCSKSIWYHRWQITVVTVCDTCYRCTMLTFCYQSSGIDTSTLVQESYLDGRYHFSEVLQHRLFWITNALWGNTCFKMTLCDIMIFRFSVFCTSSTGCDQSYCFPGTFWSRTQL